MYPLQTTSASVGKIDPNFQWEKKRNKNEQKEGKKDWANGSTEW